MNLPKMIDLTDLKVVLQALSDERDKFDTASKELDRVHKEARDARDEVERLDKKLMADREVKDEIRRNG